MIAYGMTDGSNEASNYADPDYKPVNVPLIVKQPGTTMADPEPLAAAALDLIVTQNGIPLPERRAGAIGPHWGQVRRSRCPASARAGDPIDPGPAAAPRRHTGDARYKDAAVELIRGSSQLDPTDGVTIDISPGARTATTRSARTTARATR